MTSKATFRPIVRILGLLKSSKLEYLKTSEGKHSTEVKRFLHRQARLRHHYFQSLELKIRNIAPDTETLNIAGVQMEQRLVASLNESQKTSFESCLEVDNELLSLLENVDISEIPTKDLTGKLKEAIQSLESMQKKAASKINSWF
jgi:hypothetical protein